MKTIHSVTILLIALLIFSCAGKLTLSNADQLALTQAEANGILVNEGFE